jgi:hypothetical protein
LLALGYGAYSSWRLRRWYGAALVALGAALLGLEVYARIHPEPPPAAELRLSGAEQAAMRIQLAQSELRAAGFAVPRTGDAGSGVTAVDGDFTARISRRGDGFRLERTGYPPLEGVTLPEALAKIREARTPKP